MSKHRFLVVAGCVPLLAAAACRQRPAPPIATPPPAEPPAQSVTLPAPGTEPRYAVTVDDPDEIALLTDRLKLRGARVSGQRLHFAADERQLQQLRELGYEVGRVDPEQLDSRVLRVMRRETEEELRGFGVTVVNREDSYWIISGTLAQLRQLAANGYRLASITPDEPRPRWVRVEVGTQDDVQRVANYQVDIFSVADSAGRFVIRGAALDMQIDRLRQAGFAVVLLPRP